MKVVPDYYKDFKCIADRCRHSCCKGWEIDIDEQSFTRYMRVAGPFGDKLRDNMECDEDGAHFILQGSEECCPFLQPDGLCEMILKLGESSLCQICTDHPRFRNFLSDRTETGLGLCCEAAAELILSREEKMTLVSDCEEKHTPAVLKSRNNLFAVLQDREFGMEERFENYLYLIDSELPQLSFEDWCGFYSELEILDRKWLSLLERASKLPVQRAAISDTSLEQLAVYFVFRHFTEAEQDGLFTARSIFAVHAAGFINELYMRLTDIPLTEIARMYSTEIEYSEENLQAIFDALDEEAD